MEAFVGWLEKSVWPWFQIGDVFCVVLWILVFLPMLFFNKLRLFAASGMIYTSYATGGVCWVVSFIITDQSLGTFWLIVGLLFLGVGVFPLAVIESLLQGAWSSFLGVLLAFALMLVPRLTGSWVMARYEEEL